MSEGVIMPADETAINPLGIQIDFDEKLHKYTSNINDELLEYTSVTGLIAKYFTPFDAARIAPKVAARRGVPTEIILREWDKNREEAVLFGNRVHAVGEDAINSRPIRHQPERRREELAFNYVIEAANTMKKNFELVEAEKIIFDHRLKLAGTIDILLKSGNTYLILDWKTNKIITDENPYGNFGIGPLAGFPETHVMKYALQLSSYEHILKSAEYIPESAEVYRVLLHVTAAGIVKIHLPDLNSDVKAMIIDNLLF